MKGLELLKLREAACGKGTTMITAEKKRPKAIIMTRTKSRKPGAMITRRRNAGKPR